MDCLIDALLSIAGKGNKTAGQVASAWVLARGVFPIVGPRTLAQLRDPLASAVLELDADQIRRLDRVSAVAADYPHDLLAAQTAEMTGGG